MSADMSVVAWDQFLQRDSQLIPIDLQSSVEEKHERDRGSQVRTRLIDGKSAKVPVPKGTRDTSQAQAPQQEGLELQSQRRKCETRRAHSKPVGDQSRT